MAPLLVALVLLAAAPNFTLRLSGDVVVPQGTVTEGTVVALNGSVRVDGTVTGDITAFNGDVTIDGEAGGTVRTLNGTIRVGPRGVVGGDAHSVNGRVEVATGGQVRGEIRQGAAAPSPGPPPPLQSPPFGTPPGPAPLPSPPFFTPVPPPPPFTPAPAPTFGPFPPGWNGFGRTWTLPWLGTLLFVFKVFFLATVVVLAALMAAVFPGVVGRISRALADLPLQAFLVGIGWWVVLAFSSFVLLVSIIGIPLLFFLPAVAGTLAIGAYAGVALFLGGRIRGAPSRPGRETLLGGAILALLSLIPVFGTLVLFVVFTWGMGALLAAAYQALKPAIARPPDLPITG